MFLQSKGCEYIHPAHVRFDLQASQQASLLGALYPVHGLRPPSGNINLRPDRIFLLGVYVHMSSLGGRFGLHKKHKDACM